VRVAPTITAAAAAVEVAFPSGAVIRWPEGAPAAALAAVVSSWERSPC
jgi:hypothetical protein